MDTKQLIQTLRNMFSDFQFTAGQQFCWSPEQKAVIYKTGASGQRANWSLLHETGHALLGHTTYKADFELVRLEIAAWEQAHELADSLGIDIDQDHIEDCLDTYREWLYKRSICPTCSTKCLQQDDFKHYRCFNCRTVWQVSTNRFGRAYRRQKNVPQPSAVFHDSYQV